MERGGVAIPFFGLSTDSEMSWCLTASAVNAGFVCEWMHSFVSDCGVVLFGRSSMYRSMKSLFLAATMAVVGSVPCQNVSANTVMIETGYDLLITTEANFSGINFTGNPINYFTFPGNTDPTKVDLTDTIIQRTGVTGVGGDLTLVDGTSGTMDLKFLALSLVSKDLVGGHYLYTTMSDAQLALSTGTITFDHNTAEGGTWVNEFDLHFDVHLDSVNGALYLADASTAWVGSGTWGPLGEPIVDPTTGVASYCCIHVTGSHTNPNDPTGHLHVIDTYMCYPCPEPSSAGLLLLGSSLGGVFHWRKIRAKKQIGNVA